MIRNNTVANNLQQGIFVEAWGSTDSSGSDTDFQPVIQNNLLENNGTNLRLLLNPYGADGTQSLSPVVRYNTIRDASTGILIEAAQTYDTLNPTISYNVFADMSGYAVNNTTSRSMSAAENYWGSTPAEWDAGAQPGDVNGPVSTSNPLTSSSQPVLSRMSPGTAVGWQMVTLYGANFGPNPAGEYQTTVIHYTYDDLYRLTEAVYTGDITAGYDYVYDPVGNMLAYTATVGSNTRIVTQTFNAANQLHRQYSNAIVGEHEFVYDGNGNLVQSFAPGMVAGSTSYAYDQRNLLTYVSFSDPICTGDLPLTGMTAVATACGSSGEKQAAPLPPRRQLPIPMIRWA